MSRVEPDQFIKEVVSYYKQSRLGGSQAVTLTIKPYDGRTKPEPRPDKRPKNPPKPENLCLVRAKINKTHVSTVIHAKEVTRFHINLMGTLKEHMDTLKRRARALRV